MTKLELSGELQLMRQCHTGHEETNTSLDLEKRENHYKNVQNHAERT
jgi:hypothetical protein